MKTKMLISIDTRLFEEFKILAEKKAINRSKLVQRLLEEWIKNETNI